MTQLKLNQKEKKKEDNILRFSPQNKEERLARYCRMYQLAGKSQFMKDMIMKKVKGVR